MKSYQLRGTNGSGKTFVARWLLEQSEAKAIKVIGAKKPESYFGHFEGIPLIILGSYETACGGCDTIPSVGRVAELLEHYMTDGDCGNGIIFFEGLMISHMLGTVGAMQAKLGKENNVLAFLDTPLDKCIERVMHRRQLRKDERPFDPKNVIADHPRVFQSRENAIKQNYRIRDVHWKIACEDVADDLKLLAAGEL